MGIDEEYSIYMKEKKDKRDKIRKRAPEFIKSIIYFISAVIERDKIAILIYTIIYLLSLHSFFHNLIKNIIIEIKTKKITKEKAKTNNPNYSKEERLILEEIDFSNNEELQKQLRAHENLCRNCGSEIKPKLNMCPFCGEKTEI